jgi:hypothetical protein
MLDNVILPLVDFEMTEGEVKDSASCWTIAENWQQHLLEQMD